MQTALRPFNEFAKQSLQAEFSILVLFSLVSLQKNAKSPGAKRHPNRRGGPGVLRGVYFNVPVMTASLAEVL